MLDSATTSNDAALRQRASRVIPGGLWGHMNAARLPENYPQFFARAEGCRLVDVDGRSFVDMMCAWGPIVLGHHHPAVDAAAAAQAAQGDCMNGPGPILVDLAEMIVRTVPHADWCILGKNGTDATTACVTIARAQTGRRKILVAQGAYHGAVPWCSPSVAGVTEEDRAHLIAFRYNDIPSLEAAVERAGPDLAAILVSAFRHDFGQRQELPTPEFARSCRALCDQTGAALLLDDVRAGFRLHLGGSWEPLGIRPDLAAWSKAIANGYALAAVTGADRFRDAATQVYTTGSFWCSSMSMAAAVATLKVLRRGEAIPHMERLGTRLREGLGTLAGQHGLSIRQTGPVQMPMVLFDDDPDFHKADAFCNAALEHGVYFHPRHNMFLCAAHTENDVETALHAAGFGFAAAARLPTTT